MLINRITSITPVAKMRQEIIDKRGERPPTRILDLLEHRDPVADLEARARETWDGALSGGVDRLELSLSGWHLCADVFNRFRG